MISLAQRIALVGLASIAVMRSTCSGFSPSSQACPSPSIPQEESCKHTAPSQMPTTQLSFAVSNEDGALPTSQRSVGHERPSSKQSGRQSVVFRDRKRQWVDRSLMYYSTVSREDLRRSRGQLPAHPGHDSVVERRRNYDLAQRHYFALRKIKSGHLEHAESIYRRIIDEIKNHESGCDHAKLAVSTLLLALLLQRRGDVKATRSVFLQFFKAAVIENQDEEKECACSAKVLQAYALFEMKRGNGRKSLEIVEKAVRLDHELKPVLEWKQFRKIMGEIQR